ncbi:MAG TPA: Tex family protein [Chitinophagaceae bacterium]|nr:Tex family protein [Chitinophagaceae bacterium]
MTNNFYSLIANQLHLPEKGVKAVLELLEEGATIPFIARYRKDLTGAMDEVQIQNIQERFKFEKEFAERKEFISKTIKEQEKWTEEIEKSLESAKTLQELEDIYLPFKPKRRTRAQKAREAGLEPLALWIMEEPEEDLEEKAKDFVQGEIEDITAALLGARYIIAEQMNENAEIRAALRKLFENQAEVISEVVEAEKEKGAKYKDYFEYSESVKSIPSHRILAILRGFMEGVLKMSIHPDEEAAVEIIKKQYIQKQNKASEFLEKAAKDAYKRMLQPSLENEIRAQLKTEADDEAIEVFSENLRQLLLSSPLGGKSLLAIDPGYRTGCKVVALDKHGSFLEDTLIYVHEKNHKLLEAEEKVRGFIQKYQLEAVAIGDGTAGRETEAFIKQLNLNIPVFLVNEDGASIYSGSEIGREEFPSQDITVRGAISIGRRLMDPLAELVKIDPKSIGVGQYQHDVNQVKLKDKLDLVVESCVNAVGVNLNTAGKYLLQYVSGIGPSVADNIVKYRTENGSFKNRKELLKVKGLGPKAYEQCAGFLRIMDGDNALDASGVHPETYAIVEKMLGDLGLQLPEILGNKEKIAKIPVRNYINEEIGLYTLEDILKELEKPGLDPRGPLDSFEFANIYSIEEVQVGMKLPGIVTNLTRFGAFVDIGVKQDGLVHISEIANRFIEDPSEVLKLNDKVEVIVLEVDIARSRISLSIKQAQENYNKTTQNRKKTDRRKTTEGKNSMQDALMALKGKFGN